MYRIYLVRPHLMRYLESSAVKHLSLSLSHTHTLSLSLTRTISLSLTHILAPSGVKNLAAAAKSISYVSIRQQMSAYVSIEPRSRRQERSRSLPQSQASASC
jgi:hypothetical protein